MFGGKEKKKERFVYTMMEGSSLDETGKRMILVDRVTGVNYLMILGGAGEAAGLTVMVDENGKPLITPVED